ncbi:homocysteine S-methyltransferase family protein [Mesorhizobium sp. IMUNJ 23232]|uniref:homocysteine S-methyltransferase family protein n=1 Tax=Mesorhizobium sp. IMUNJ 23232 TaxID=3376064 RepID=UPI0037888C66
MSKYRHDLPQLKGGLFLSDGGMETQLIFLESVDLPHFASYVLLESEEGRARLKRYYEHYLGIAARRNVGFLLESATWRANPDWAAKIGHDAEDLKRINTASIRLLEELREKWETPEMPCVISAAIGPRGDGYKADRMEADEAESYHAAQIETLAGTNADMVSAFTMNNHNEAIGIARAAKKIGMPCMISFTVETDGKLVTGMTLGDAVNAVDDATGGAPAYYMINCAHPTHFSLALAAGESWIERVRGVRANASARSHQELDESDTLDAGDPIDLGRRYQALRRDFPGMRILGGCCGTDHRHVAAICEACVPDEAKVA